MAPPPPAGAPADAGELYEEAACGLVVTTADGRIVRANRTFCRWIGDDEAGLVAGTTLQELLTIGGRIFHQTHWAPLLQIQGSVAEVKLDLVRRDGRKVPMMMNAQRREHGGVVYHELAVFVAEDRHRYEHELVLARRRAEELLAKEREAQEALAVAQAERDRERALADDRALFAEQMVGIVSHDLRTPLSIVSLSSHLIGAGELSTGQQRALQRIGNAVGRANRLIADLLDFTQARLGSGLRVQPATIDLHAVVHDSLEDLRLAFVGRNIVHERSGEGPCVAGSDRLVQMIGNLVANAVAYGAAERPVTVTSTIVESAFSIAVHNEGEPIRAALLDRLFEPMTRGDSSEGAARSVGLGLFIVREIVRAHGGTIAVESSADRGTRFTATFPRAVGAP